MKSLIIFAVLIAFASCEVEIPNNYQNAKTMADFYGFKLDNGIKGSIAGGGTSNIGDVPYFVLTYIRHLATGGIFQCGGSLISHNWILTAAHCFEHTFSHLNSYLGIVERNSTAVDYLNGTSYYAEWESGTIPISSQRPHPLYNPSTFTNDIALLMIPMTETFLKSLSYVSTVKLPTLRDAENNFVGFQGSVSGFGMTENGTFSDRLRTIDFLPIISVEECRSFQGLEVYVTDLNICTSNRGRETVCQGDGGGPLVVTVSNARRVVGVVTFTVNACLSGYPGSYTRVTSYLSWISTIIGSDLIEDGSTAPASIKLSLFLSTLAAFIMLIK